MGYHLNRLDENVFMAVSKPLRTEFGIHHRLEKCVAQFKPFLSIMFERGMVFGYQIRNGLYLAQLFLCSRTYQGRKKRVGWSRKRVTRRCVQWSCTWMSNMAWHSSFFEPSDLPHLQYQFFTFFPERKGKNKKSWYACLRRSGEIVGWGLEAGEVGGQH